MICNNQLKYHNATEVYNKQEYYQNVSVVYNSQEGYQEITLVEKNQQDATVDIVKILSYKIFIFDIASFVLYLGALQ